MRITTKKNKRCRIVYEVFTFVGLPYAEPWER